MEKNLIAASLIFSGLSFLVPNMITLYTYMTKYIPEETNPAKQTQMKLILVGSALAGVVVVGSGIYYLKKSKCL
jgi:hypothetical protein